MKCFNLSLPDPSNQQSFLFFLFLPPLTPLFFSFVVRVLTSATPWVLPLQFLLRDFMFNLFTQEAGEALRLPFLQFQFSLPPAYEVNGGGVISALTMLLWDDGENVSSTEMEIQVGGDPHGGVMRFATRVQLGMLKFKEATCWQMKAGEEGGYSMELLDLKGDLL
ncbi:hypothetical protein L1987_21217 [Smallanthus sonchifolius]|uniref:Uncharacterized protein n=1 Tax=Smallanthus sonchifolius TaxID=185202 RepID=A0ACB9ITD3_9ASTR|nr:hypothetical protein L1987_21217 [Smallanthus sonchifolius]